MKHAPPSSNASLVALLTAAIAGCSSTPGASSSSSSTTHTTGAGGATTTSSGSGGHGGSATGTGTGGTAEDGGPDAAEDAGDAGIPTVRRPFLVGSSLRSAGPSSRADWSHELAAPSPAVDRVTAARLAEAWLRDGLEEHASIAAFARFTLQLLSVGAPPDLVAGSQRASLDEIRHARACFALAGRYGGRAQGPSAFPVHDALGARSLAEIAALTAEEGCVGETLGAALAVEMLAGARDPEVTAVLRRVAADEARHAELAWRFAGWACRAGGEAVERAIVEGVERAIAGVIRMEIRSYDGIDLDAWHAHGRVTCLEARASAERTIREVVRPCLARLSSGGGADAPRPLAC